jgi:hypothetical protein
VTLVLKVVVVILVLLLLAGIALRVRKIRRDEMRELSKPIERRLFSPPPSPYAPSKGFRLIDESGEPLQRPEVERPRLDPEHHYVFSETTSSADDVVSSHLRHKDDWFLSRSSHRSTLSIMLRRAVVILLIALIVAVVVTYYVNHSTSKVPKSSATSPTTTLASTTTTTLPFVVSIDLDQWQQRVLQRSRKELSGCRDRCSRSDVGGLRDGTEEHVGVAGPSRFGPRRVVNDDR